MRQVQEPSDSMEIAEPEENGQSRTVGSPVVDDPTPDSEIDSTTASTVLAERGRVAGSYGASVGVRLSWLSRRGARAREGGASWQGAGCHLAGWMIPGRRRPGWTRPWRISPGSMTTGWAGRITSPSTG